MRTLTEGIRDQLIIRDELRRITGWCALVLEEQLSWKNGPDREIPGAWGQDGEAQSRWCPPSGPGNKSGGADS